MNDSLKLPTGDLMIFANGKWESYCMSDGMTKDEARKLNAAYWKFPTGTKALIRNGSRTIMFEL